MKTEPILPYRVLIVDDQEGDSCFGLITKELLETENYQAVHVTSATAAMASLNRGEDFDIFVIDVNLQGQDDGRTVLSMLRKKGYSQPIALATANPDALDEPIQAYAEALSNGPVVFVNKTEADMLAVVEDLAARVDSLRRSLRLLRDAGLGDEKITIDDKTLSVDELLGPRTEETSRVARALGDALNVLLLRAIGQPRE